MANRETYPASLFPLRGDLSAEAGATTVLVVGIDGIAVSAKLATQQAYVNVGGLLTPVYLDTAIQVDGVPVSDDYTIAINHPGLHGQVLINGS